jgi:hypothetical protein
MEKLFPKARKAAKAQKTEKAARRRDLVATGQDPDEDMDPRPDDLVHLLLAVSHITVLL